MMKIVYEIPEVVFVEVGASQAMLQTSDFYPLATGSWDSMYYNPGDEEDE